MSSAYCMVPPWRVVVVLTTNGTPARGHPGSRHERRGQRRAVRERRRLELVALDEVDPEPRRDRRGPRAPCQRAHPRELRAKPVAVRLDPPPHAHDPLDPLELAVVRLRAGTVV